jgi:FMN phosphatase YigB (HAD superfamily)
MIIRTIAFDFGNVIGFFESRRITARLAPHVDMPAAELHKYLVGGDLEVAFEAGRITAAEFVRRARERCGFRCSDDDFIAAWNDIFSPNDELIALLPRLKPRYRLLLGSNTNELHFGHYRRQFAEALQHMDALVASHEVGARKPAAAFFEHCQRLAAAPPEECLFIDDLPANIAGAAALGWNGIVYRGVDDLKRELTRHGVALNGAGGA